MLGLSGVSARAVKMKSRATLALSAQEGVLTSRWKISATFTREKLGALTSRVRCVLAERVKVKGGQG